jgi:hypothetical protein
LCPAQAHSFQTGQRRIHQAALDDLDPYPGVAQVLTRLLDAGRQIATEYQEGLPADSQPVYDNLLARAAAVHRLPFTKSTPESHMAASKLMVDEADELYAVWDGKPARSSGRRELVSNGRQAGCRG